MAANEDFRTARNAPDPYVDEPEEEELFDDEQPPRKTSRVLPIVVASLAILGFVVIVYYAYQQGIRAGSEQNPPIIKAEEGPTKVRPASPGGMEVPNQGMKVYELGKPGAQTATSGPERILPKPEEPLQRPAPAPEPVQTQPAPPALVVAPTSTSSPPATTLPGNLPPLTALTGTPLNTGSVNTPPPPPLPGSATQAGATGASTDAQTPTAAARSANLGVPAPPPPAAPPRDNSPPGAAAQRGGITLGAQRPAVPAPTQQAAAPAQAPAAPAPPVAAAPTPAPATIAPAPAPAASPPAQQAAAARPVPPIGATPASGGVHVQLAAPNTPQGAEQTAQTLAKKYADVLGNFGHEIQRHEDNRGVFFRVLFGPVDSKADAAKICESLKTRNQGCIVR